MADATGEEPALAGETVLETERLLLRRWRLDDAVMSRRLWEARDLRVPPHRRISADGRPSLSDLEDWIRCDDPCAPLGLLVAVEKAGGTTVGYCGLIANVHGQDDEPELAYELLPEARGRGFATEAALAVVGWASTLGYRRLWATIRDWNTESIRVATRVGFAQTSRVEPDAAHGDSHFFTIGLIPRPPQT